MPSTSASEGKLTSKIGLVSVEQVEGRLKIACYINNYEVENYFLKGMAFANKHELQSLNGARFFIKRTDFYGSVSSFSSGLNRDSEHQLRQ